MPELVEDAFTRLGGAPGEGGAAAAGAGGAAAASASGEDTHVFEDLESRMFYESLPDIRYVVSTTPAIAVTGSCCTI